MNRLFKKLPIILSLLLLLVFFAINACKKKTDSTPNPNSSDKWGEFIPIPGITASVAGDDASELKTTNEGFYMRVDKASTANPWIYRLQGSSAWILHEEPDLYFDWEPCNYSYESPDDFSIFFHTIDKNGIVSINTGDPALLEENNPPGFPALLEMLVDKATYSHKWAFFGDIVKIQDNSNLGLYNPICTLPAGGILFAEADPFEPMVWAAAGKQLYKIDVFGAITIFDVSTYDDPTQMTHSIEKIRFSYDVVHKDVYFRYQNKVFKIANGTTLSLFYTINNGANFGGGDFCVDNSFMYATDGTKKDLGLLTETNIIPPMPTTSDQAILMDYITQTGAFAIGPIEVSKDPLDDYIYAIYHCTLLKVPKTKQ